MEQKRLENRSLVRIHFILALILLLHSVLYLIYWLAVPDFRLEVDHLLTARVGLKLPYASIFIVLTALIILWSLFRFIKYGFAIKKGIWKPSWKNWLFFAVWLLFLIVFYGSFWLILRGNPSQKGVVFHLLNIIRLFSDALILLLAAFLLWRLIKFVKAKMTDDKKKWPLRVAVILALIVLIGLWLVPTIFPPNWAYRGNLPTKPAVIADGGAAMLAPENTLAAVELAEVHDAFGFETTVRISSDGEPFLLQDETFARTTNIAEVYPSRVNELATSFDIEEIEDLNAGLWFIQSDPYDTIENGDISQTQLSINQGQRIPTLAEALEFVADQDMVVLLHLVRPPQDHPYYDEFFDIVLSVCQESDLNDDIWLELEQDQIRISQSESPQITRVLAVSSEDKPKTADILAKGYEIVHVDTGIRPKSIRELREEGLGVNVHTINQSWLFSQFWLSGVTSISTKNVQSFSGLEKPFVNMPLARYLLFWVLFGLVLAIWLASSFPLPERKVKEEVELPTPTEPALEGEGQAPAVSPEAPPVVLEPAEAQLEEALISEDLEETVEPIESVEPIEPVESVEHVESVEPVEPVAPLKEAEPIEYREPIDYPEPVETDEVEDGLSISEQWEQIAPVAESTQPEELETLNEEEQIPDVSGEGEHLDEIEESVETLETDIAQAAEDAAEEALDLDDDLNFDEDERP